MLGWEYPPKITGGLGVASQGIAEALADKGYKVSFLLPKKSRLQVSQHVKLMDASKIKPDLDYWKKKKTVTEIIQETELGTRLLPYLPPETFVIAKEKQQTIEVLESTTESDLLENITLTGDYEGELATELLKYALIAVQVARKEKPKLIHAHDWITFRAGAMIKKTLKTPLYLHVHSTEYDRNGGYAQPFVIEEERKGFDTADHIFCVSHKLKNVICEKYGVEESKISVVPNAVKLSAAEERPKSSPKTIAFIGRLTHQKSPFTFVDVARELHSRGNDFKYLVIGDGYLRDALEDRVKSSNFSNKFTFTGFLDREKVMRKLNEIDLLIMPSAAEPFGLVALEAVMKKIPVAAATGMGVAEFVPSIPQVDRWDHYNFIRMVEKLMKDKTYRKSVVENCLAEAKGLIWKKSAEIIDGKYLNPK